MQAIPKRGAATHDEAALTAKRLPMSCVKLSKTKPDSPRRARAVIRRSPARKRNRCVVDSAAVIPAASIRQTQANLDPGLPCRDAPIDVPASVVVLRMREEAHHLHHAAHRRPGRGWTIAVAGCRRSTRCVGVVGHGPVRQSNNSGGVDQAAARSLDVRQPACVLSVDPERRRPPASGNGQMENPRRSGGRRPNPARSRACPLTNVPDLAGRAMRRYGRRETLLNFRAPRRRRPIITPPASKSHETDEAADCRSPTPSSPPRAARAADESDQRGARRWQESTASAGKSSGGRVVAP